MLRTNIGTRILYSGSVTWSSGSTATSAQTLSISAPTKQTTVIHEFAFYNNGPTDVTADIRPVSTIASTSVNGDFSVSVAVQKSQTIKGITVAGKNQLVKGMFNQGTVIVAMTPDATTTATVTVALEVRETEGAS